MNIFNDVLRNTKNIISGNELSIAYLIIGSCYCSYEIINDTSYYIRQYKLGQGYKYVFTNGEYVTTVGDAIKFAIEYGKENKFGYGELRMADSALWPFALVRKILPSIIYYFNRNVVVDKIESEYHHDFSDMGSLDENKIEDENKVENDELDN